MNKVLANKLARDMNELTGLREENQKLMTQITALQVELRIWKSAIGYMSQYNGRSVRECLQLAKEELGLTEVQP